MDIILIPGLWLAGPSWQPVTDRLKQAGHAVQALTLPGMESKDADRSGITLDDHVAAVLDAVDAAAAPALVVGHSASATLAYCAGDARPDKVARLVYIGGFPVPNGEHFMAGFPTEGDDVRFPGWAAFEGPDSADIEEATKAKLLEKFIPSPAGVLAGTVQLTNERRYDIPATAICPEYSSDDLRAWIDGGDIPELARPATWRWSTSTPGTGHRSPNRRSWPSCCWPRQGGDSYPRRHRSRTPCKHRHRTHRVRREGGSRNR